MSGYVWTPAEPVEVCGVTWRNVRPDCWLGVHQGRAVQVRQTGSGAWLWVADGVDDGITKAGMEVAMRSAVDAAEGAS